MQRKSWGFATGVLAITCSLLLAPACQNASESESAPAPQYRPTATVRDLMRSIVDESADVVWLAVMDTQTEKGLVEVRPQNDEDWEKVRFGALALAEAANLLLMPDRAMARPGETSVAPGVELHPDEIQKMREENPDEWNRRVLALQDAATKALAAIEKHDAEGVFAVGEEIELACEGCHTTFWYPNEVIPEFPDSLE